MAMRAPWRFGHMGLLTNATCVDFVFALIVSVNTEPLELLANAPHNNTLDLKRLALTMLLLASIYVSL